MFKNYECELAQHKLNNVWTAMLLFLVLLIPLCDSGPREPKFEMIFHFFLYICLLFFFLHTIYILSTTEKFENGAVKKNDESEKSAMWDGYNICTHTFCFVLRMIKCYQTLTAGYPHSLTTGDSKTFSGLRSQWTMFLEWRYFRAIRI